MLLQHVMSIHCVHVKYYCMLIVRLLVEDVGGVGGAVVVATAGAAAATAGAAGAA